MKILSTDKAFFSATLLMLVETWLLPSDEIILNGFEVMRRIDCTDKRRPFGSILLVSESEVKNVKVLDSQTYYEANSSLSVVSYLFKGIGITFLYKSPLFKTANLILHLHSTFEKFKVLHVQNCVVVGDFNINFMKISRDQDLLHNFMKENKLTLRQNFTSATDYGTMIDLCFSNINVVNCKVYESVTSDHKPLWFNL